MSHLMYFGKWHAFSVGGGYVTPTRPTSRIMHEDSAAATHCNDYSSFLDNQRLPGPYENYLVIGHGSKMVAEVFGW